MKSFVFSLIFFLVFVLSVMDSSKVTCVDIGGCMPCQENEMIEEYCEETGYRIKQLCETEAAFEFEDYRSCHLRNHNHNKKQKQHDNKDSRQEEYSSASDQLSVKSASQDRSDTLSQSDAGREQYKVVLFQVSMAVVAALSFWAVQIRKQSHMTLYDNRKERKSLF